MEGVTVKLPCGGVESWKWEEVGHGEERYGSDEGVFEAKGGFMIAWLEEVEERVLCGRHGEQRRAENARALTTDPHVIASFIWHI